MFSLMLCPQPFAQAQPVLKATCSPQHALPGMWVGDTVSVSEAQVHILAVCTTDTHVWKRTHTFVSISLQGMTHWGHILYFLFFLCGDLKLFITAQNHTHPGYPIKEGDKSYCKSISAQEIIYMHHLENKTGATDRYTMGSLTQVCCLWFSD